MARLVALTPNKTYASVENAIKAVEKKYPQDGGNNPNEYSRRLNASLTYFIQPYRAEGETDWRYFPVFIGERSIQAGVHFHFNVVS